MLHEWVNGASPFAPHQTSEGEVEAAEHCRAEVEGQKTNALAKGNLSETKHCQTRPWGCNLLYHQHAADSALRGC